MANTSQTVFCTIVTQSHLDYALALYYSYRVHSPDIPLVVVVVDLEGSIPAELENDASFEIISLKQIEGNNRVKQVIDKYKDEPDLLRWSLKPAVLLYLLEEREYQSAVFMDCDLCFFNPLTPILDHLEKAAVLLSPHWRNLDPYKNPNHFRLNFTDGMFNGGFVGASQGGIPAMNWWLEACIYRCERLLIEGFYDDQKYLDLLPAQFEGTEVLFHRGCNVANWNLGQNIRTQNESGQSMILGKWPIIFVHFSGSTVKGILKGEDPLLLPNFDLWKQYLDQAAKLLGRSLRSFELVPPPIAPLPKRILYKLGLKAKSK